MRKVTNHCSSRGETITTNVSTLTVDDGPLALRIDEPWVDFCNSWAEHFVSWLNSGSSAPRIERRSLPTAAGDTILEPVRA
jgi:hypothetical protein